MFGSLYCQDRKGYSLHCCLYVAKAHIGVLTAIWPRREPRLLRHHPPKYHPNFEPTPSHIGPPLDDHDPRHVHGPPPRLPPRDLPHGNLNSRLTHRRPRIRRSRFVDKVGTILIERDYWMTHPMVDYQYPTTNTIGRVSIIFLPMNLFGSATGANLYNLHYLTD